MRNSFKYKYDGTNLWFPSSIAKYALDCEMNTSFYDIFFVAILLEE